jgi:effector-binding domain-containing protein
MSYNCEVKEQLTQATLSIRTRTPVQDLAQILGKAYGAIAQYLGELGEQPAGPPFAAYYNMDMQDLDVEAGFPVSRRLSGKGDIKASEIPGGKVATCLYTGPYSEIEPAYTALSQWITDNGYEATGVVYEMYLNDPTQTPPQELKTQIVFTLRSA